MNASIHLTHSFAFSAFSIEISFTAAGFENGQNLKLIFERMHKSEHLCHQNHTHKIVHSSAMFYQKLNVIGEPSKKLLMMKSVKKNINT